MIHGLAGYVDPQYLIIAHLSHYAEPLLFLPAFALVVRSILRQRPQRGGSGATTQGDPHAR